MKIYLFSALLYFSCLYKIFAQNTSYQGNNFWLTYGAQHRGYNFSQPSLPYSNIYSSFQLSNTVTDNAAGNLSHLHDTNAADVVGYQFSNTVNPILNREISPSPTAEAINTLTNVDFDLPKYCVSDGSMVFVNKTTYTGTGTLTYLWNFGDFLAPPQYSNTSTERDGTHTYTDIGVYEVTLTVTSSDGYTASVKKQFTVNGNSPKAAFEVINQGRLCSNNNVEFRDKATVNFGEITKIEWYFDFENNKTPDVVDNAPLKRNALAKVYTYKYATFTDVPSKNYVVKMKAYSGSACASEEVKTITVYALPKVDFQLESSCLNDGKAKFKNLSTYAAPSEGLTFRWDFGDADASSQNPNNSELESPEHAFNKAGTYTVSLTVATPNGCEQSISKEITIDGARPKAEFSVLNVDNLCDKYPVTFEAKTSIAFGKITKIEWYFDYNNNPSDVELDISPLTNGGTKTYSHQYPLFNFPFSKSYLVRMMAYSDNTCVGVVEKEITINAMPDIEFLAIDPICSNAAPIQLTASEKNNMPGTGEFSGKGTDKSGVFDPKVAGPGIHSIKYTFLTVGGCSKEIVQNIVVYQSPVVNAGVDITVNLGNQVKLNATATGGENMTYKWSPAIGLSRDDVLNPTLKPTDDMTYTLTVTNEAGCEQSDQVFVKVLRLPEVPSTITPNGDLVNDTWKIKNLDFYQPVQVKIYNRNGSLVFSSKGYATPFDGTYNGTPLPIGVYYYVISLFGYGKPITGALTILR